MGEDIHKIIYYTTRGLMEVSQKLSISNVVLFCYQRDDKLFAELLYGKRCVNELLLEVEELFGDHDIKLRLDLDNPDIVKAFKLTIEEVRRICDKEGYYKALHEGDEFAEVAYEMHKIFNNKSKSEVMKYFKKEFKNIKLKTKKQ